MSKVSLYISSSILKAWESSDTDEKKISVIQDYLDPRTQKDLKGNLYLEHGKAMHRAWECESLITKSLPALFHKYFSDLEAEAPYLPEVYGEKDLGGGIKMCGVTDMLTKTTIIDFKMLRFIGLKSTLIWTRIKGLLWCPMANQEDLPDPPLYLL